MERYEKQENEKKNKKEKKENEEERKRRRKKRGDQRRKEKWTIRNKEMERRLEEGEKVGEGDWFTRHRRWQ